MSDEPVPDRTDDIMCATYRALCRHGYADLTMQDIADEWSKSKATLHYHYDTKRGLLLAFLDHLFDSYTDCVADPGESEGDAADRLRTLIDDALDPPRTAANEELRTALFEIKARAPHDDDFRDRLERFDRYLRDETERLVRDGVDAGVFRADVDPETTATLLVTLVDGGHSRRIVLGDDEGVREAVRAAIDDRLAGRDA